jgi:hypothetical protein
MKPRFACAAALAMALSLFATPLSAQTVWTDWTSASAGTPGSAAGTLNGVVVSYSGEVLGNTVVNGSSGVWNPSTSFVGGTVSVSPDVVGDIITLAGSFTGTSTLSFATPIANPVFAIWSLGQPGGPASFTFDAAPVFEVGGPNANFGGLPISVAGNVVSGTEGNGVVRFDGSVSSISWTSTPEFFYGFTVGTAGGDTTPPIPEPGTSALMLMGLAGLALGARWKRRR